MSKVKKRIIFIIVLIAILLKSGLVFSERIIKNYGEPVQTKIYNYLSSSSNRMTVYEKAAILNNRSTENSCVYFVSEVLRANGVNVPQSICNTSQLVPFLQEKRWTKDTNYKNLQPGAICFTTDSKLSSSGIPSHTYVFMAWVKDNSYDYAYVCDNQAKDYSGKIYHIRNISKADTANGKTKDPFSYFLYKK